MSDPFLNLVAETLENYLQKATPKSDLTVARLNRYGRRLRRGQVARYQEPRSKALDDLAGEFDDLLARLQTPKARKGMKAAFNASPLQLGRAAVKAAKDQAPDVRAQRRSIAIMQLGVKKATKPILSLPQMMQQVETDLIQRALDKTKGNPIGAAQLLGIKRSTLNVKCKHYKISISAHKAEARDQQPVPDNQLLNKELNEVIQRSLALLDDDKRVVFTLKVFQRFSYEEIAAITGFSIPKLKTDLHRARSEMRRRISSYVRI